MSWRQLCRLVVLVAVFQKRMVGSGPLPMHLVHETLQVGLAIHGLFHILLLGLVATAALGILMGLLVVRCHCIMQVSHLLQDVIAFRDKAGIVHMASNQPTLVLHHDGWFLFLFGTRFLAILVLVLLVLRCGLVLQVNGPSGSGDGGGGLCRWWDGRGRGGQEVLVARSLLFVWVILLLFLLVGILGVLLYHFL